MSKKISINKRFKVKPKIKKKEYANRDGNKFKEDIKMLQFIILYKINILNKKNNANIVKIKILLLDMNVKFANYHFT